MRKQSIVAADLQGVFPVPPLARAEQGGLDFEQNQRIVDHILSGGPSRLLYGGNAFLYHITLQEYEPLLEWMASQSGPTWCIPSAGPSFGRGMDQARLLRRFDFPCFMMLPCRDPRDASGLERGLRAISDAAGMPLIVYCKEETDFGADLMAGLDAVGRLVDSGVCVAVKYAVIRERPEEDHYLAELLKRVDKSRVLSGIGERPAIAHLKHWGIPGFTTGSGCIAPRASQAIFDACVRQDWETAGELRAHFLPLEDIRDRRGPARVLHHATETAGIARTGPIPPFVSPLPAAEIAQHREVVQELLRYSCYEEFSGTVRNR